MDFEGWRKSQFLSDAWSKPKIERHKGTWQASRENQQEYQEYEFCLKSGCGFYDGACPVDARHCKKTAKELHHWLKENGYKIVKGAK